MSSCVKAPSLDDAARATSSGDSGWMMPQFSGHFHDLREFEFGVANSSAKASNGSLNFFDDSKLLTSKATWYTFYHFLNFGVAHIFFWLFCNSRQEGPETLQV